MRKFNLPSSYKSTTTGKVADKFVSSIFHSEPHRCAQPKQASEFGYLKKKSEYAFRKTEAKDILSYKDALQYREEVRKSCLIMCAARAWRAV